MYCRVCNAEMKLYDNLSHTAAEVAVLFQRPTWSKGHTVEIYHCAVCGHLQIPSLMQEQYYDDYLMSVSHSPKIQKLQAKQIQTLASLAEARNRFLEVGCGDGAFLQLGTAYFKEVLGIEPSRVSYECCKQKGLKVINAYVTSDTSLPQQFDAFAARQVFEHLDNPVEIVAIIAKFLTENAIGLIEVPNAEKMIAQKRYFDLFTDHVNYFTPTSLCHLAKQAGFTVELLRQSFNGDYLELYIRKPAVIHGCLASKRNQDIDFLLRTIEPYKKVAIWGAGAKTQSLFTICGAKLRVARIFDSDPQKIGRYVINSSVAIEKPSIENILENELIMIFAVSYQDEILNLLRNTFHYKGDILCLENQPCIVRYKDGWAESKESGNL